MRLMKDSRIEPGWNAPIQTRVWLLRSRNEAQWGCSKRKCGFTQAKAVPLPKRTTQLTRDAQQKPCTHKLYSPERDKIRFLPNLMVLQPAALVSKLPTLHNPFCDQIVADP